LATKNRLWERLRKLQRSYFSFAADESAPVYSRSSLCLVKRRVVFLLWQKSPPYGYRRLIDQTHFSRPSAAPKPEADSRSNQPPVPVCHSTGKTAVAAWWEQECP
jgi:hypothetical protein